jgi:transcriptional regulator with XRE-family HTH domain
MDDDEPEPRDETKDRSAAANPSLKQALNYARQNPLSEFSATAGILYYRLVISHHSWQGNLEQPRPSGIRRSYWRRLAQLATADLGQWKAIQNSQEDCDTIAAAYGKLVYRPELEVSALDREITKQLCGIDSRVPWPIDDIVSLFGHSESKLRAIATKTLTTLLPFAPAQIERLTEVRQLALRWAGDTLDLPSEPVQSYSPDVAQKRAKGDDTSLNLAKEVFADLGTHPDLFVEALKSANLPSATLLALRNAIQSQLPPADSESLENATREVVARNIVKYRTNLGMSQRALSQASDVSNATISLIEGRKQGLSIAILFKIANGLKVHPSGLLSDEPIPQGKFVPIDPDAAVKRLKERLLKLTEAKKSLLPSWLFDNLKADHIPTVDTVVLVSQRLGIPLRRLLA